MDRKKACSAPWAPVRSQLFPGTESGLPAARQYVPQFRALSPSAGPLCKGSPGGWIFTSFSKELPFFSRVAISSGHWLLRGVHQLIQDSLWKFGRQTDHCMIQKAKHYPTHLSICPSWREAGQRELGGILFNFNFVIVSKAGELS